NISTISNEKFYTYEFEIVDAPVQKTKSIKIIAQIININDTNPYHYNEKVMLYLKRDSLSDKLQYGHRFYAGTKLSEVSASLNPHEFNYKSFLNRKGIRYQSYISSEFWSKSAETKGNILQHYALSIRNYFLKIFQSKEMDVHEMGVITAILLGYDEVLDPELAKHYTGAGVSHILCVSGMHVGILFLLLNLILGFLDKRKHGKVIKSIILLLFVWFYALITGLSPSVMRAATMFTFVIVGNGFKRNVSIYNSLLGSMMFLLLINPNVLFEVGFQLSYLAVFSIVWLQKPLYNVWRPKNKALDYFWQLISVSIAAQALTTPITLYYFHQFPNYFILSNIVTPVLSSVVMYLGIALISFSFIPFLSDLIATLLVWSIKLMNFLVISIHELPGSVSYHIDVDFISMILLYLAMFSLLLMLLMKQKKWLLPSLMLWILFFGYIIKDKWSEQNTQKLTFYAIRNQSLIELNIGGNCFQFCDSKTADNIQSLEFQTKTSHIRQGIIHKEVIVMNDSTTTVRKEFSLHPNYLVAGNKKILFINRQTYKSKIEYPEANVDIVYIHGNPWIDLEKLHQKIHAQIWLIDGTNSPRNIERLKEDAEKLGLNFHFLLQDGALEIRL
ncbi:MAG: ComEC family competence protein, partial [Sphingobacteriia bacterium]|nr:ComEC family competence protein [Sphingobacteriia bacterium]